MCMYSIGVARRFQTWQLPQVTLTRSDEAVEYVPRQESLAYGVGLFVAGSGRVFARGAAWPTFHDGLLVLQPGDMVMAHSESARGWSCRALDAEPALLEEIATDLTDAPATPPDFASSWIAASPALIRRFVELHRAVARRASRLEQDWLVVEVLSQLVAAHAADRRPVRPPGREPDAVRRAIEYVEGHYAEGVSLDELAAVARLGKYHLARVFRRAVGLPPHAYLTQVRVARAKQLLNEGARIDVAARRAGFASSTHLRHHFRRTLGVTPGAYTAAVRSRVRWVNLAPSRTGEHGAA